MQNIIRHIKDYNTPIPTDDWYLQKLAEIGKLNKENIKIIAQASNTTPWLVEQLLTEAGLNAAAELEPAMQQLVKDGLLEDAVEVEKSSNIKKVMNTYVKQAKSTLNMCNTNMLYKARDAYKNLLADTVSTADEIAEKQSFLDMLNTEATTTVMGAESRAQALRKTVKRFNDAGIPAFVDSAGRDWSPEAYVSMALRTTASNVANEAQMARCDDYDIDLISVTSHAGARPKCAKDQGKIFDRTNKSTKYPHWNTSSYGQPDGLLGINCGHHIHPYIEGVSIQRYFPTEDLEENNKEYQEVQKQRGYERSIRKQKRECVLFNELGDDKSFEEASVKLKAKEAQLKQYVNANPDLHRRKDREQILGFNKVVSSRAISADKKVKKELAEKARDDRIKAKIKETGIRGKVELHPNPPDLDALQFDDEHINKQRKHNVTASEANEFIKNAEFSVTRWNGKITNYYSQEGAAYVDNETNKINTAFKKSEYDDKTKKSIEVIKSERQ